jgi:thiosulfate/3-mercaptopyruvate sulfurtransferase
MRFETLTRNHHRKFLSAAVAFFVFLALTLTAGSVLANGDYIPLVETDWLAKNLDNSDIKVVHVAELGPDAQKNFDSAHIPGSVFLGIGDLMGAIGNGSAAPDKAAFEALMGKLGISNDTYVIISGVNATNPFTTGAFWLMKYHGHKKVSYLNGGLSKWKSEGRPVTDKPTPAGAATYKVSAADSSIFTTADHVLASIGNPKVAIVDVRSADEYAGKANPTNIKRVGHIPGAINMDFASTNLNSDGTFKSLSDLKAAYEAKGVTSDKEVITYCIGGLRAANTHFVLKYLLNYPNVKDYIGSWDEWGGRLDESKYPVEK